MILQNVSHTTLGFFFLSIWASALSAQPSFQVGTNAGPLDEPVAITLDFDDGGIQITEFALTVEYDPNVLIANEYCDYFLSSASEAHLMECGDHPSLGTIEISMTARTDPAVAYPPGKLGEIRLTSIAGLRSAKTDQLSPVVVSNALFIGLDSEIVTSGMHTNGVIHIFPNWPLDDSDAVETEPDPVLPPFDGRTRRMVGGGFQKALTFHESNDEDWLGLPGNAQGHYEVSFLGALRWQVFDMAVMGSETSIPPLQSGNSCASGSDTVNLPANSPGALLVQTLPCSDSTLPMHYEISVTDQSLFVFPTGVIPMGGRVRGLFGQSAGVILVTDDGRATYSDPDQGYWDITISEDAAPRLTIVSNRYHLVGARIWANRFISLPAQPVPITGSTLELSPFRSDFSYPAIDIWVSLGDPVFSDSFESEG